MRYLAIDYGLKRVGLAICDAEETIVSPLQLLKVDPSRPQRLIEQIERIVTEHQVEAVVVGLPLNMDDSEGQQAQLTRQFVKQLCETVDKPVHFQDERLSSEAADGMLAESGLSKKKRKEKRDMLAACEILNDFLNRKRMTQW
ncbi:MAG: Holliday junction resolvase RuvX [Sedimentisphaerales bacterium]|nr:Holliday junction resolvase RuvX [Sedimentisphaerales bacterium]